MATANASSSSSVLANSAASSSSPQLNGEACGKLIDLVWNWDHIKMFHEPVSDAVVPGYSAVITDPIDLTSMREKLTRSLIAIQQQQKEKNDGNGTATKGDDAPTMTAMNSLYTCDTDVVNDLDLMVTNALLFNAPGSVWHNHAKALRKRIGEGGDFIAKSGVVVDEEELVYVESGSKKERNDYSKSLRKEEKKKTENISDVLSAMQSDLEIPIEELRKRFGNASENLKKLGKKRSRESNDDEGSSDGSSSSSSSSGGSSSEEDDDDDEEGEEYSEETSSSDS